MAAKLAARTAEKQAKGRGAGRPFRKGVSGNPAGRPKGSRDAISENFISSLSEDFAKHGPDAIRKVRLKKPEAYLRIVADLVPKNVNLNHDAGKAFVEIVKRMSGVPPETG